MTIEIKPLDTLFFRDGKPFTMGSETWADGIFPPHPSVFYGAIRSTYFAKYPNEIELANEKGDPTNDLKITKILYKIGNDYYFPLPLDYVHYKDEEDEEKDEDKCMLLQLTKTDEIYNSCKTDYILKTEDHKKAETISNGIIRIGNFKTYLNANEGAIYIYQLSELIKTEPKVGITRSNQTHTSEEHKLYRVGMRRLSSDLNNSISFVLSFEGLDIDNNGLMKLGGEGKAVKYSTVDNKENVNIKPPKFDSNDKYFKLVLTTPAIFKKGWLPSWIDKKNLEGKLPKIGTKVKLMSASIGKPISIGGFDMKKRIPKPTRKAVPAGSVYFFKLLNENDNINNITNVINGKAISDSFKDYEYSKDDFTDYEYSKQGFGIAYISKLNEKNLEVLK